MKLSTTRDTSKGFSGAEQIGEGPSSFSRTKLRSVGRSRIIAELGHGGMANVYLAVSQGQAGIQKLVVLKALRPELESEPEAVKMFLDEARLAAQLNHPNVVQTYEIGIHEGRSVLIMEYLEGQSLARLMRDCDQAGRPLPLAIALRIMIAALEGLHYAHELKGYDGGSLNLVHRDISPQNVFVTYDGHVKLLDFGIAKVSASSTHTAIGVLKGKFAYMSPEQMRGQPLDRRADIYSVGCMLWAFAAGHKLWRDVPDGQIIANVMAGEIPPPASKNPNCDPQFVQIIARAMASDPEQRHATALELQADLEWYSEKLGAEANQKAIGKLMVEQFADARARIRELIQAQLSQLAEDAEHLPSVRLLDEQSSSSSQVNATELAPHLPPGDGRRLRGSWLAVASVAALLSAGAWAAWRTSSSTARGRDTKVALVQPSGGAPSERPPLPAAPAIDAPSPARMSKTFTVEFAVEPDNARLYLDGTPLPTHTKAQVIPADGATHVLRAEARGYQPGELDFSVTRDTRLELSLSKLERARTSTARPTASPAKQAVSTGEAAPPAPASPACSDPFFIGPDGIKQVRSECR